MRPYYIVVEWEDEQADREDGETGGAYEYATETDPLELITSTELAKREAEAMVASGEATWATVLVGTGETWEDVDVETAALLYSYTTDGR